jgi:hypothetical protein
MKRYVMRDSKQKTKLKLVSVKIDMAVDECPDLSWLGEYSDKPGRLAIDRQERGDMGRSELRYFNPVWENYEGHPHEKGIEQDYARMEAYNRGDWWMNGITAKAVVHRSIGNGSVQIHEFQSGGLWGIESDCGDYKFEVADDQLAELKQILSDFGVPLRGFKLMTQAAKESIR